MLPSFGSLEVICWLCISYFSEWGLSVPAQQSMGLASEMYVSFSNRDYFPPSGKQQEAIAVVCDIWKTISTTQINISKEGFLCLILEFLKLGGNIVDPERIHLSCLCICGHRLICIICNFS